MPEKAEEKNAVETAPFRAIADFLRAGGLFNRVDFQSQRALLTLYRLIAEGEPVSVERLAVKLGLDDNAVQSLLGRLPPPTYQYDEPGRIIGFGGLSQSPTRHRFTVGGRDLYTWCAFDGLFLPALLDSPARITTACPVTRVDIRLTVTPEGVEKADPDGVVMSFVMPETAGYRADLRGTFCRYVNFFASDQAGTTWLTENPGAAILSLAEAYALGRIRNETGFKDILVA
ncbi:MAG: alkylmercury lyase MerB [Proteobacteria bacterium]|jgi:alkylmercury lyase|nr:alkylmercury lyase MerB [Pseudomonadota bacterium]